MLEHMRNHLLMFICPSCGGDLLIDNKIKCIKCNTVYLVEEGVPLLFQRHNQDSVREDVTEKVKTFYEVTPFPNYEEFETVADLIQKAEQGLFARLLNEQIPFNTKILEVGCGTGQLTNYLGVAHRVLFGADMCINSLKLAHKFKEDNHLERVEFYQMNLFRPIFKEE